MRNHPLKKSHPRIGCCIVTAKQNSQPIVMRIESRPLPMRFCKTLCSKRISLRLAISKLFARMFELDVNGDNSTLSIAKEKNRIRFQSFAASNSAFARTVLTAPIICPEWLYSLFFPPAYCPLFFKYWNCTQVLRSRWSAFNDPVPDLTRAEEAASNHI